MADLGFDSLQILEVIAELEDRFDISIPLERRAGDAHRRAGGGAGGRASSRSGRTPDGRVADAARGARRRPRAPTPATASSSGDGDRRRSYADICSRRARRVARSLREAGLRRGDLVALVLADAEQFLTTLFGASIAGVMPASLYPPATTSDLPRYLELTAGILRASGARAVVTSARAGAVVRGAAPGCARSCRSSSARDDARRAGARARRARRRSTTSRSCSSRRDRRRRRRAWRSRTATCRRTSTRSAGPSAVAIVADGRRRQLAAAQPRHGAGRHGARRALRRAAVRAAAAAGVRQAAGRMAAGDLAASRHGQLRAELRLRPVRPPRQGSRSRGPGSLVLARRRLRRRADSSRRRSRPSPRSSRRPGSATTSFLPVLRPRRARARRDVPAARTRAARRARLGRRA